MNDELALKRKIVITALAGLLMGTLLLIFGLSIKGNNLPMLLNYIISIFLYLITFLALFKRNKIDHQHIYVYLMILSMFMFIFATIAVMLRLVL